LFFVFFSKFETCEEMYVLQGRKKFAYEISVSPYCRRQDNAKTWERRRRYGLVSCVRCSGDAV
jgi:Zn ribbon nucleic-acid-binding protein